jgi:hypothetical protein
MLPTYPQKNPSLQKTIKPAKIAKQKDTGKNP